MIITIRGTSGSGKSTIVRRVMDLYAIRQPIVTLPRKKVIAYWLKWKAEHSDTNRYLTVLGSYETPCGGCDTLSFHGMRDMIDEMARTAHGNGRDVLFEGLILGGERTRMIQMAKDGLPLVIVHLTTPEGECLDRVAQRRKDRGVETPLDPTNTVNKAEEVRRACRDCRAGGVDVREAGCEEAFELVRRLLGV